jgi:hypothetical protein
MLYRKPPLVGHAEFPESRGGRRDPAIAVLVKAAETEGVDILAVGREVWKLERAGATVTPEVMTKVIADVRDRTGPVRPMVFNFDGYASSEPVRYRSKPGPLDGVRVVYYMRVGNRVKIGTSVRLSERMKAINPEELMTTEFGGIDVERRRHEEFKLLRTHGEWFKLEGPLVEHIDKLRAEARASK